MNIYAKLAITPALVLAAAMPLASVQAGTTSATAAAAENIVVTSRVEMKAWQNEATRQLDRALRSSPIERTASPSEGIVQVAFTLGADGRADNIEVVSNSANWVARKSAVHAVRRLSNLDSVPVTNRRGAQFLANLIFADDEIAHRDLAARLAEAENARLALGEEEEMTIVLGG